MSISVNTGVILDMQRKLYRWSRNDQTKVFSDLFNLVCDRRTLKIAWEKLCRNAGSRTAGIDGLNRRKIEDRPGGVEQFLEEIREELRSGTYAPQPVRQRLIPKPNRPGQFRPLGIPTMKDRLVQMALKLVLEPIFEADFYPTSYGFRRGRSTLDALAMIQRQLQPTCQGDSPIGYVIEGDIKGCFDNIDHHRLMEQVRRRINDSKVLRLIHAFLKAGIMAEGTLRHPVTGTPQGGIISPMLANIYLTVLDARYRRWIPGPNEAPDNAQLRRRRDIRKGRPTFYLVRYADDFVILTNGTQEEAEVEKVALAEFLQQELGMELSMEKTLVSSVDSGFGFLGYRVVKERAILSKRPVGKLYIPKEKLQQVRDKIRTLTGKSTIWMTMDDLLKSLNPLIVGWRNYFRYAIGASKEFASLDRFVWLRIQKWAKRKHSKLNSHEIRRLYARQESPTRSTWGGDKKLLMRFGQGRTQRYLCRGTRISNGWNDEIDGLQPSREVARPLSGFTMVGENL